ncbi:MAG: hypothetical protein IPJ38_16025 [Dechloromonas sp.]|uniref:Calcium-binding protein n=1 Tax=Candidatus Dechloromonas phosphorivorans TaxID=2899244 RepID=A0A935MZD9_9RHOO|nr:hypothetical protein [Candidatus Dechloromonas phosphorivorans]
MPAADRLQGGQGDDVLLGGSGNDTGIWTGSAHGVRVQELGNDHWRITWTRPAPRDGVNRSRPCTSPMRSCRWPTCRIAARRATG